MAGVRPPARTSKASKEWWEPEESTGWWDEFKKLGEPRVIRHEPNKYFQTTWEGANASQRAWFKEMGKLDLRLVWRTKGMTMLERQRLYSEFLLPNQWYQATVVAYYEGTEMESVGKSLDKKYKRVDPLDAIVNRKLGVDIAHWYSNGSRVMSSSSRASAVKLATGDRGWIIGGSSGQSTKCRWL